MVLDHILDASIAPVLILLEVGDEAGSCDASEPSRGNTLYGSPQHKGGQIQA